MFSLEINIQLSQVVRSCSFLHSVYDLSLKKKEKVIVLWCVFCLFQYADFVFPELFFFFWHCTFNLKCFLYLLDIGVLPFLIGLYNFAMFYSLCFMVTVCSVRTKTWRLCPTEWRLLFLWCSPLASCLFSHDIY